MIRNDESGIPDAELYAAILRAGDQEQGNKDGILTVAEAEKVTYLVLPYNVTNYKGLSYLKHLQNISLQPRGLEQDFYYDSFFAEYETLEELAVIDGSTFKIRTQEDLETLVAKETLRSLNLDIRDVDIDWAVLKGENLTSLSINSKDKSEKRIVNVSAFVNLRDLDLSGSIVTVTGLEHLRQLKRFSFSGDKLISYIEIGSLPLSLNSLSLVNIASVSEWEELEKLTELTDFGIAYEKGNSSNISIGRLPASLRRLYVERCTVQDLKSVAIPQMKYLESLYLEDTGLESLEGVEQLTELRDLSAENNRIREIHGIKSLTKLERLSLPHNEIEDVSVLQYLPQLGRIDLAGNRISSLPDLSNFKPKDIDIRSMPLHLEGNLLTKEAIMGKVPSEYSGNALWMLKATSRSVEKGFYRGRQYYQGNLSSQDVSLLIYENHQNDVGFEQSILLSEGSTIELTQELRDGLVKDKVSLGIGYYNINEGRITYYCIGGEYPGSDLNTVELPGNGICDLGISEEDRAIAASLFVKEERAPKLYCFKNAASSVDGMMWMQYIPIQMMDEVRVNTVQDVYDYYRNTQLYYFDYGSKEVQKIPQMEGSFLYELGSGMLMIFNYEIMIEFNEVGLPKISYGVYRAELNHTASEGFYFVADYNGLQEKPASPSPEPPSSPEPSSEPEDPAPTSEPPAVSPPSGDTAQALPTPAPTQPSAAPTPAPAQPSAFPSPESPSSPEPSSEPEDPAPTSEPSATSAPSGDTAQALPTPAPAQPSAAPTPAPTQPGAAPTPAPKEFSAPVVMDRVESAEEVPRTLKQKLEKELRGQTSVTVDAPMTLTHDIFETMRNRGKGLSVTVTNENNEKLYQWSFESPWLQAEDFKDVDLTVRFETEKRKEIEEITGQKNAFYMSFSYHGVLPAPATMTIYVGNHYKNGDMVYLYHYDGAKNEIKAVKRTGYVVQDGYVTYRIWHCSDYFLAQATPDEMGVETEEEPTAEPSPTPQPDGGNAGADPQPEKGNVGTEQQPDGGDSGEAQQPVPERTPPAGEDDGSSPAAGNLPQAGIAVVLALGLMGGVIWFLRRKKTES